MKLRIGDTVHSACSRMKLIHSPVSSLKSCLRKMITTRYFQLNQLLKWSNSFLSLVCNRWKSNCIHMYMMAYVDLRGLSLRPERSEFLKVCSDCVTWVPFFWIQPAMSCIGQFAPTLAQFAPDAGVNSSTPVMLECLFHFPYVILVSSLTPVYFTKFSGPWIQILGFWKPINNIILFCFFPSIFWNQLRVKPKN